MNMKKLSKKEMPSSTTGYIQSFEEGFVVKVLSAMEMFTSIASSKRWQLCKWFQRRR